jgi:ubiquinone/menaquinone biosynthesis C-methylase UbiE
MQDTVAERAFYDELFSRNPENEHITGGYDELHELAFPSPPEGRIMDLGCGTGAHAIRLARRGCNVLAVDLSLEGVKAARERFRREDRDGLFVVSDAERLPFRDNAVAAVWSSLLLHHFPRLDLLPDELARVSTNRVAAVETNAHNLLSWLAFNVVNRVWGLRTTTRNQRALFPKRLNRRMSQAGFRPVLVKYVHRAWQDASGSIGLVRGVYDAAASMLPERFRANKFLVIYEKAAPRRA